jgi:hypothetical protein
MMGTDAFARSGFVFLAYSLSWTERLQKSHWVGARRIRAARRRCASAVEISGRASGRRLLGADQLGSVPVVPSRPVWQWSFRCASLYPASVSFRQVSRSRPRRALVSPSWALQRLCRIVWWPLWQSLACSASAAVTSPAGFPARSTRSVPSVLAARYFALLQ